MAQNDWTIPDLLQLSGGYWAPGALHAGVKLDIFTALSGGARTAAAVAAERSLDLRATAMLLDALAAMGLLTKQGDTYATTAFAAENLVRTAPGYLGHIIQHHHHLMAGWAQLPETVKSGGPIQARMSHADDAEARESFLMGMFNLASQLAPRIVTAVDLSGRTRLLDLGGGPGTYAIHFCRQYPELTAVDYDLPTTRDFAEGVIDRFGLAERVTFHAGDYLVDPIPPGFDVAWLSHILHSDGPAACATILRKAVAALEPGGLLLVQEFIMDDAKDGPLFPALFSLNMLLGTSSGQSYAEGELAGMMTVAGLQEVRRLPLDLPNGAGIMMGKKAAGDK
jgi:SAM-dependent methyltransferase